VPYSPHRDEAAAIATDVARITLNAAGSYVDLLVERAEDPREEVTEEALLHASALADVLLVASTRVDVVRRGLPERLQPWPAAVLGERLLEALVVMNEDPFDPALPRDALVRSWLGQRGTVRWARLFRREVDGELLEHVGGPGFPLAAVLAGDEDVAPAPTSPPDEAAAVSLLAPAVEPLVARYPDLYRRVAGGEDARADVLALARPTARALLLAKGEEAAPARFDEAVRRAMQATELLLQSLLRMLEGPRELDEGRVYAGDLIDVLEERLLAGFRARLD
jgi:hypothetical protein